MRIGKHRERIKIIAFHTVRDAGGGIIASGTDEFQEPFTEEMGSSASSIYWETNAEVRAIKDKFKAQVYKLEMEEGVEFVLRNRSDKTVSRFMQVFFKNRYYTIHGILDSGYRGAELVLVCKALKETGAVYSPDGEYVPPTDPTVVRYTMFGANSPEILGANPITEGPGALSLGTIVKVLKDGQIKGVRYYRKAGNAAMDITGKLYNAGSNVLLASKIASPPTAEGWQDILFDAPVNAVAGMMFKVVIAMNGSTLIHYFLYSQYFATTVAFNEALEGVAGPGNGVFATSYFDVPMDSFNNGCYFIDILYDA